MKTIFKTFLAQAAIAFVLCIADSVAREQPVVEKQYHLVTINNQTIAINCSPVSYLIKLQRDEQARLKDAPASMPNTFAIVWSAAITKEEFEQVNRTKPGPKQRQPFDFKSP